MSCRSVHIRCVMSKGKVIINVFTEGGTPPQTSTLNGVARQIRYGPCAVRVWGSTKFSSIQRTSRSTKLLLIRWKLILTTEYDNSLCEILSDCGLRCCTCTLQLALWLGHSSTDVDPVGGSMAFHFETDLRCATITVQGCGAVVFQNFCSGVVGPISIDSI